MYGSERVKGEELRILLTLETPRSALSSRYFRTAAAPE